MRPRRPLFGCRSRFQRLRGLPDRKLSQRHQRWFLKESYRFSLRPFWRIDYAAFQPVKQRARRNVYHHHLIRLLNDPVRYCLAHSQASDMPNLVAETRQILHIHRRKNVHATVEQNLHVLPASLPFRPGRVRMCQIVHDAHFRATLQDTDYVQLLDVTAATRHAEQRHHLKFFGPLYQITAILRLKKREDDVHTARFDLHSAGRRVHSKWVPQRSYHQSDSDIFEGASRQRWVWVLSGWRVTVGNFVPT